jgi:hypothetical protein
MKKVILLLMATFPATVLFAQVSPATINTAPTADTVRYAANKYPLPKNSSVYRLIQVMDGFEFGSDGLVMFKGLPVNKIKLNGTYFGHLDVSAALKKLPADIVANVEVIDLQGTDEINKGVPSGKLLNINFDNGKTAELYETLIAMRDNPFRTGQKGMKPRYGRKDPLNASIDAAIARFYLGLPSTADVDEYGDQIPHFLLPPPWHFADKP